MGVIYRNGIPYGGGDNSVILTKAEYDALPEAEKMNGVTYYVTDEVEPQDATDLSHLTNFVANTGIKNLVSPYGATKVTQNGLTITIQKNGEISVVGTPTGSAGGYVEYVLPIVDMEYAMPPQVYACTARLSVDYGRTLTWGVRFRAKYTDDTFGEYVTAYHDEELALTATKEVKAFEVSFYFREGTGSIDATATPMIVPISVTDTTYQQAGVKTNKALTDSVDSLDESVAKINAYNNSSTAITNGTEDSNCWNYNFLYLQFKDNETLVVDVNQFRNGGDITFTYGWYVYSQNVYEKKVRVFRTSNGLDVYDQYASDRPRIMRLFR